MLIVPEPLRIGPMRIGRFSLELAPELNPNILTLTRWTLYLYMQTGQPEICYMIVTNLSSED